MNEAIGNTWSSMSSWFSPTVLFCLLNLVIGTIFLSSNLKSNGKNPPQQNQPDDYNPHNPSHQNQNQNQTQPDDYNPHNPPQLARAPSLLDRVRSIKFSLNRSDSLDPFQPETHHTDPVQTQLTRAPSNLDRAWSNNFSLNRSDSLDPSQPQIPVETQLARAPSIIERVKSFNFSLYGYDHPDPKHHSNQVRDHHVTRSKSDTTGEGEGHVAAAAAAARMRKSASEKWRVEEAAAAAEEEEEEEVRRPATVREGKRTASFFGEDEEVDEKADDFINKFKQQLKLQRLDSLLRYKEMLNRGSGR